MPRLLRLPLAVLAGALVCRLLAGNAEPLAREEFTVREWHAGSGLPNDDVYQLLQDRDGYLWVACRRALSRFDGTTFVTETAPETGDILYSLTEEPDGSLLLAGRDGDLVRRQGTNYVRETLPAPYAGRPVGMVFRTPDGAHWYGLRGAALRIDGGTVQEFDADDGLGAENWVRFATDGAGRLWLASHHFVARYDHGRLVPTSLDPDAEALRLVSSREDGPWMITAQQVWKFDAQDRPVQRATLSPLQGAHYVNAALEDRAGALWIGTRSVGLHRLADGQLTSVPTSSEGIQTLLEDREGIVWAGTSAGGLNAIARRVCTLFNKASRLAASPVQAICVDPTGAVWIANGDAGVARFAAGRIDQWRLRDDGRIFAAGSVSPHPAGGVWATGGNGLAVFHVTGAAAAPAAFPGVPDVRIHANLFTSRDGALWFTTADRRVGRRHQETFRLFGPEEGVDAKGVRTIAETADGRLLLGTNDGELRQFTGSRFEPTAWPVHVPSAINAIQSVDGELWLATAGHGIAVVDARGAKFVDHTHGLPEDSITEIQPDGRGYVWCGASNGVFRVTVEDVRQVAHGQMPRLFPLRLGRDEGVGALNCQGIYGPGVARDREGHIWFATRQGALAINPEAETLNPPEPRARIEQVRIDEAPQPLVRPFRIESTARKIEIHHSALCLTAPSRVQVRYRLVGFDGAWVTGKPGEPAIYPRLPPGAYRFEVAAGFDETIDPGAVDSLELRVPPPWWQAWWLRLAVAGTAAGSLALIVRAWSHRRLRRRIARLEHEAEVSRVRERIARDIHDDVGASLTRICLLAHGAAPDSAEAQNLTEIESTAREVTRSLDEIVWAVNPQYDTLEGLASYLTSFAQKYLAAARIPCRLQVPTLLPAITLPGELRHDVFLCCREALTNVIRHADASEVTLRLSFAAPTLEIVIADNGRGVGAPPREVAPDRVASGHGLANMRQRMSRLGGACVIAAQATGGTSVTLRVSIPSPPAHHA